MLSESVAAAGTDAPLSEQGGYTVPGQAWQRGAVWQNNKLALKTALKAAAYIKGNQPGLKETFSPLFRAVQQDAAGRVGHQDA